MFPGRHAGGASSTGGPKAAMGIIEHLDRIREEYNQVHSQYVQQRAELEKTAIERDQCRAQMMMYCDASFQMQAEVMKQTEIAKKLAVVMQQIITLLPPDQAATATAAFERAKQVAGLCERASCQVSSTDMNQALAATSQAQAMAMLQNQFNMQNMQSMQMPPGPFGIPPGFGSQAFAALAAHAAVTHQRKASTCALQQQASSSSSSAAPAASTSSSRPRSANKEEDAASAAAAKRPKIEHDDEDGNIDIEVAVVSPRALSSQIEDPSSSAQTNGHDRKPALKVDSGRESAQSVGSSGASTPGIPKPPRNPFENILPIARIPPTMANNHLLPGFDPHQQARMIAALQTMPKGKPSYSFTSENGALRPTSFPSDAFSAPGVPSGLRKSDELPHGDVVCAVTIARDKRNVFTGGKGCVKVWSLQNNAEVQNGGSRLSLCTLECLHDTYIRSLKLVADCSKLYVGGEAAKLIVFDVNENKIISELETDVQAVYALALSPPDEKVLYACGADGKVIAWDTHNHERIDTLAGHQDGASCVDFASDGFTLWTGGLDNTVRAWDTRVMKETSRFDFSSQIFSLGCSPTNNWIAIGEESNQVEVFSPTNPLKYALHMHESCVLSLRYSHSGNWFASTGKDNAVNVWRSPYGANLVNYKETSSVLSVEISHDDQILVTGSGEKKATVYEVQYNS